MEWTNDLHLPLSLPQNEGTAVALGAFDGLHCGHMAVLNAAKASPYAHCWGVFTFAAPPFQKPELLLQADKRELLQEMGAAFVLAPRFEEISEMPAEDFAEKILFTKLSAKRICCGEDFRFGKGAEGDTALLSTLCAKHGAELVIVPPVEDSEGKISSTRIRAAIEEGNIELANRLLGREYQYTLPVIHGNHIGTGLGTPTLNQAMPQEMLLPPFGVYASLAFANGGWHFGVTNIGVKPTVGSDKVLSETWLPKFSGDLYGKQVKILLLSFLRAERKFASLDELREEIQKNAVQAEKIALQMKADMLQ